MIVINNICALPIAMAVWVLDMLLLMMTLRLIVGWLPATRDSLLAITLAELIDPMCMALTRHASRWVGRPCSSGVVWLLLILAAVLARDVLAILARSMA